MRKKKSLLWSACLAATMSMGFSAGSSAGVWLDVEGKDIGELSDRIERIQELNELSGTNPWMGIRLNLSWSEIPMGSPAWSPTEEGRLQYDFTELEGYLDEVEAAGLKVILTISDKYWNFRELVGNDDDPRDDVFLYTGGALPAWYTSEAKMGAGNWKGTQNGVAASNTGENYLSGESCLQEFDLNKSVEIDGEDVSLFKEILTDKFESGAYSCGTSDPSNSYRFAVVGSKTNSRSARKYGATRWNPKIGGNVVGDSVSASIDSSKNIGHWFKFWEDLASTVKDHPALYAVVTPESSVAGISYDQGELAAVGYKGGDEYYLWQIAQAKKLAEEFDGVPVISSINWVSELDDDSINTASYDPAYFDDAFDTYQNRIGTAFESLNSNSDTALYGWWAQDLRRDKYSDTYGNTLRKVRWSYEQLVYPQFDKIEDASLKFAMITGDTFNNSVFQNSSNFDQELAELADSYNVGHLVFLDENIVKKGYAASEVVSFINNITDKNSYSFLNTFDPVVTFSFLQSWVNYDETKASGWMDKARKIVVKLDENVSDCSAQGVSDLFTVTVDSGSGVKNVGLKDEVTCNGAKVFLTTKWNMIGDGSKNNFEPGDVVTISYSGTENVNIVGESGAVLETFNGSVSIY